MIIEINVIDKVATVLGTPVIICGNTDYKLSLTFDAEWSDQAIKTARFVYIKDGEVKSVDVPFDGTQVEVPKLHNTKEVYIGVYAGDLYTTTPARVPCAQSIRCMAAEPEAPLPNMYDQILAMLNAGIDSGSVKYVAAQELTDAQKAQARENIEAVPTSRTVNGKALSADISLTHSDVGAAPAYTYGTDDIVAGSASSAATGTLHFVYE